MKTRNNKAVLFAALISLVAGCATEARRQSFVDAMQSWVGQDTQHLVDLWGYPDDMVTAPNGNTVYVYAWSASRTSTSPRYTGSNGREYGGKTSMYNSNCTKWIEISNNQVVTWRADGNACY